MTDKILAEFVEVKYLVEQVMTENKHSRNSDKILTKLVWEKNKDVNPSTILRVRRLIQNKEHRLIPTDPLVARKRLSRQKEFWNIFVNHLTDPFWKETLNEVK